MVMLMLMCPVWHYTIDAKKSGEVIQQIEPLYVIPMHFRTEAHKDETYEKLTTLEAFLKEYGTTPTPVAK